MTSPHTTPTDTDDVFARIELALDGIRPYIASHRGSVEVIDFDAGEGRLFLRLGGTCQGCAAASITLTQGIEVRLREAVPEVRHLEAI
ncbi:MAG TPA: NifU family protein [Gemmatimonadales bacterium]|nr:NifU family protein [Gemmatimonadales bacterium]